MLLKETSGCCKVETRARGRVAEDGGDTDEGSGGPWWVRTPDSRWYPPLSISPLSEIRISCRKSEGGTIRNATNQAATHVLCLPKRRRMMKVRNGYVSHMHMGA